MPLSHDELLAAVTPTLREIAGPGRVEVVTLPGGASLRRYHRAKIAGGRPESLVVMELGDDRKPEEVTAGGGGGELPFIDVLRYLERGGIAVPRMHRFDEPRGLLYLEDLGDDTFESRVQGADDAERSRYYRLAIDDLVAMQSYAAAHPAGSVAFSRGFDRALLLWELEHFREWGLEAGAGAQLAAAERSALDEEFAAIADTLAAEPRGFVHRDYQSRNLMVQDTPGGPRLRLIDFQDALLGTRAYDLVALLRDSYVALSTPLLDGLVSYYAQRAGLEAAAFRRLFDLQTVQRKLKDAGRFVFIDRVKRNPAFLQHIPQSHAYVAAALARLPERGRLREIVGRYVPALAG
jgi:aminoglycoside/choline kinase family phosphotransferase